MCEEGACPCYWGFKTTGNLVAWCLFLVFVVVGCVMLPLGCVKFADCYEKEYKPCMDIIDDTGICRRKADDVCQIRTWAGVFISGILMLILAQGVTYYFCCCSSPPRGAAVAAAVAAPGIVVGIPYQYGAPPVQGYAPPATGYTAPFYPPQQQATGQGEIPRNGYAHYGYQQ